jgi:hypothetical protein
MSDGRHDGEVSRLIEPLLQPVVRPGPILRRVLGNFLDLLGRTGWKVHANLPGKLGDETVINLGLPSATPVALAFAPFGVFKALGLRLFDGLRLDQHTLPFIAFSRPAPLDYHRAKT